MDWQADPIITAINTTSYPIANIEFPAITICSQGLAKDVMENVMMQQFKHYMVSRNLIVGRDTNINQTETSNTTNIKTFDQLTNEEASY